jgi:hypothetical protein
MGKLFPRTCVSALSFKSSMVTDGCPDLFSATLSQFNSEREKFVPNGFQECSQMNTSEGNNYGLVYEK